MRTACFLLLLSACGTSGFDGAPSQGGARHGRALANEPNPVNAPTPSEFAAEHPSYDRYWHAGMAELNRYALRRLGSPNE